ncbi:MAG: hypothetical protein IKO73_09375 [Bacteroidaceae bacterium]|nr:hypothetical protein [Bacteroidaceae bacterium]
MTRNPFNKIEEIGHLIKYINDNREFSDEEISVAIDKIDKTHFPLEHVNIDLYREVESLVEDWCDECHVDDATVWDALDIEELISKL